MPVAIELLACTCLVHLLREVPSIAVISSVNTGVGAMVSVIVLSAHGVEDVAVGRIREVHPGAGNFNLSISEVQVFVLPSVDAELTASTRILINSAVVPCVIESYLASLTFLSLGRSARTFLSTKRFHGRHAISGPSWVASECFLAIPIPGIAVVSCVCARPLAPVEVSVIFTVGVEPYTNADVPRVSILPLACLTSRNFVVCTRSTNCGACVSVQIVGASTPVTSQLIESRLVVIRLFTRACIHLITRRVPLMAIYGFLTSVSAPVRIAILHALFVEDLAGSHVCTFSPAAGNINLRLSKESVVLRSVAHEQASLAYVIDLAVVPSVI